MLALLSRSVPFIFLSTPTRPFDPHPASVRWGAKLRSFSRVPARAPLLAASPDGIPAERDPVLRHQGRDGRGQKTKEKSHDEHSYSPQRSQGPAHHRTAIEV